MDGVDCYMFHIFKLSKNIVPSSVLITSRTNETDKRTVKNERYPQVVEESFRLSVGLWSHFGGVTEVTLGCSPG